MCNALFGVVLELLSKLLSSLEVCFDWSSLLCFRFWGTRDVWIDRGS